jgi:hypothetical protein
MVPQTAHHALEQHVSRAPTAALTAHRRRSCRYHALQQPCNRTALVSPHAAQVLAAGPLPHPRASHSGRIHCGTDSTSATVTLTLRLQPVHVERQQHPTARLSHPLQPLRQICDRHNGRSHCSSHRPRRQSYWQASLPHHVSNNQNRNTMPSSQLEPLMPAFSSLAAHLYELYELIEHVRTSLLATILQRQANLPR